MTVPRFSRCQQTEKSAHVYPLCMWYSACVWEMPRDTGKRRRASSGPSRISPPNKREKRGKKSPKTRRQLLKEHASEFDLHALEKDKENISEIVASDLSAVPESENMQEPNGNDTRGPADFDGFSEEDILPTDTSDDKKILQLLRGL